MDRQYRQYGETPYVSTLKSSIAISSVPDFHRMRKTAIIARFACDFSLVSEQLSL
jgi:hypothetical protein